MWSGVARGSRCTTLEDWTSSRKPEQFRAALTRESTPSKARLLIPGCWTGIGNAYPTRSSTQPVSRGRLPRQITLRRARLFRAIREHSLAWVRAPAR